MEAQEGALDEAPEKKSGGEPRERTEITWSRAEKALAWAAGITGLSLGGLGLYSSFFAMYDKAASRASEGGWEWGHAPWMLPAGVDLSILVFSIINLLLIKFQKPMGWVKWVPRLGTVVTIVLNWSAGVTIQSQIGHAALAGLWVVLTEVVAHLYAAQIDQLHGRATMERIRFGRWIAHPIGTARIRMLMISCEITSYAEALERDKDLSAFKSGLRRKHGRRWRFKAKEEDLQVLRLVRYGMTVEQALEEPLRRKAADRKRELQYSLQEEEYELQEKEAEHERELRKLAREDEKRRKERELEAAAKLSEERASAELQEQNLALQNERAKLQAQLEEAEAKSAAEVAQYRAKAAKAKGSAKVQDLEAELQRRREQMEEELRRRSEQLKAEAERAAEERRAEAMKEARELVEGARAEAEAKVQAAEARLAQIVEEQRQALGNLKAAKASIGGDLEAVEGRRREIEGAVQVAEGRLKELEAEYGRTRQQASEAQRLAEEAEARLKAAQENTEAAREEAEALLKPPSGEVLQVALLIMERRRAGAPDPTIDELKEKYGFSQGTASGRRKQARKLVDEILINA